MIVELGIIAGDILIFLEGRKGPVFIKDIYLAFSQPKENICMAIGWLTREGFVRVVHDIDKGGYQVSLNKQK